MFEPDPVAIEVIKQNVWTAKCHTSKKCLNGFIDS